MSTTSFSRLQARRAMRLMDHTERLHSHSGRMDRLGTESAFVVLARAKELEAEGKSVIHLQIGEPDFDTPQHIIDAAKTALDTGATHYTPAAGTMELRQAICKHMLKTRGVECNPTEVVVVPGAKPILFFTILALVEKGDEVVYPNPGFPIYESMINFAGAKPVPLRLGQESNFRFTEEQLRAAVGPKTKLIILNSPHNPTGGILTKQELEWVAAVAKEYDCMVLSDEVYDEIIYEGKHESILSIPGMKEYTVCLGGHSKNYAMTGWRLGYGVMPADIAKYVTQLMINCNSCAAAFTQKAGVAALEGDHTPTKEMVAAWKERGEYMVKRLNAMGLTTNNPGGAFYVFPSVESTGCTSSAFAKYLLEEWGVACLDGGCFGEYGRGFVRFSAANSMANIEDAMNRVEKAVAVVKASGIPGDVASPTPGGKDASAASKLQWKVFNETGSPGVLVTKNLPGTSWLNALTSAGFRVDVCQNDKILSQEELRGCIATLRPAGVIGQLTEKWDKGMFEFLKGNGGRAYSNYAVGFDNVDVAAAAELGIHVGNTPGVLTETTAEMAVALTFACARRIPEADSFMREYRYHGWLPNLFVGNLIWRKTVGVIGAGRIGAAFARMLCEGHKCNIVYHDPYPSTKLEQFVAAYSTFLEAQGEKGVTITRVDTPEDVLKTADIVSLHPVLDASSRGLINKERLALMKPDAILINSSRGPVVDEKALVEHLKTHPDFRVGLDVFEREPAMEPGLEDLPNCVIAPHIASATQWTRAGMAALAAANVRGILLGHPVWDKPDFSPFADLEDLPNFVANLVSTKQLAYNP